MPQKLALLLLGVFGMLFGSGCRPLVLPANHAAEAFEAPKALDAERQIPAADVNIVVQERGQAAPRR